MHVAFYHCESCNNYFGSNFTRDVVAKCECGENALRIPRSEFLEGQLKLGHISKTEYNLRINKNS